MILETKQIKLETQFFKKVFFSPNLKNISLNFVKSFKETILIVFSSMNVCKALLNNSWNL